MKLLIVPEVTRTDSQRLSMSSAISSLVRSPGLWDWKSRRYLFSEKTSWNDLEGTSRSLATNAQLNRPHISLIYGL